MDTTQTHPPKPAVCGTCAEWTRHTDPRMPDHGECAQRGVGCYSHRQTACLFNPLRWSLKKNAK